MRRICTKRLLLTLLILFCVPAFSQVHKWVDEQGVVHFSDLPPEDVATEVVPVESGQPENVNVAPSQTSDWVDAGVKRRAGKRQARAEAERDAAREGAAAQERCTYARQQLISLEQNLPVYRDETGKIRTRSRYDVYDGRREYLDDATRALEIDRVQQEINTTCENPDDSGERSVAARARYRSKRCEDARERLAAELRPGARATRQDIEHARQLVEWYCDDES